MGRFDVVVIGGGQSGLAMGYYLRRTGLSYIILDNQQEPGGAWLHTWETLRLFSPAQWSSLPGMIMNGGANYYPTRNETIEYLAAYESKYNLSIGRPITVSGVTKQGEEFIIQTSGGLFQAKALVSATGTFSEPFIPAIAGMNQFVGDVIHSSQYRKPNVFAQKRVAVIGEGNSGAQILAEISKTTDTLWITQREPRFLPDHIDGRYLFDAATQMYEAQKSGKAFNPPSLGDIVMVDTVKEARSRDVLKSAGSIKRITHNSIILSDGNEEKIDALVFCTGFKPSLSHLAPMHITDGNGKPETIGTKSKITEGLWFVGYGNWTGFASATLIGVGRSAKATTEQILEFLSSTK